MTASTCARSPPCTGCSPIAGENRERRRQRTHPAKKKPELIARRPEPGVVVGHHQAAGPERGVYYELFVIIDIFSRYVVGWTRRRRRDRRARQGVHRRRLDRATASSRDQLTLHADRGTSMTSKPVAQLLVDLGVARIHSRPHVSNDNPYTEAQFKTLKYCPAFPGRFGSIEDARAFCEAFFDSLQPRAPPLRHRAAHPGLGPLRHRHRDPRPTRRHPQRRLRRQPRPIPAPSTQPTEAAHRRLDQRTHPRSTHPIRIRSCLIPLDRLQCDASEPCPRKPFVCNPHEAEQHAPNNPKLHR